MIDHPRIYNYSNLDIVILRGGVIKRPCTREWWIHMSIWIYNCYKSCHNLFLLLLSYIYIITNFLKFVNYNLFMVGRVRLEPTESLDIWFTIRTATCYGIPAHITIVILDTNMLSNLCISTLPTSIISHIFTFVTKRTSNFNAFSDTISS